MSTTAIAKKFESAFIKCQKLGADDRLDKLRRLRFNIHKGLPDGQFNSSLIASIDELLKKSYQELNHANDRDSDRRQAIADRIIERKYLY